MRRITFVFGQKQKKDESDCDKAAIVNSKRDLKIQRKRILGESKE